MTIPLTDEEAAVLAAVEGLYETWRACARSIPDCDPQSLWDYRSGVQADRSFAQFMTWQAGSYEIENADSYTYVVWSSSIADLVATVTVCESSAAVLVHRPPDGPERVVDDEFESNVVELTLERPTGQWKVVEANVVDTALGEEDNLCV